MTGHLGVFPEISRVESFFILDRSLGSPLRSDGIQSVLQPWCVILSQWVHDCEERHCVFLRAQNTHAAKIGPLPSEESLNIQENVTPAN